MLIALMLGLGTPSLASATGVTREFTFAATDFEYLLGPARPRSIRR